ncbi:MAG: phage tail assembly protein [Methyloprofundus sp.]|nr:phage tail assembly protein [Methyloprofundus sp.]
MTMITLKYPVTVENQAVTAITLRRPKVRDMLASDKLGGSDSDKEIRIFANLAEVSPAVIEELDLSDYAQLQKAYQGFLS